VYQRRFDGSIWTPSWAPRTLPDNTVTSGFATAATNPDDLHIVYTVGAEIVHWRLKDNARIRSAEALGRWQAATDPASRRRGR
jgi:hypothetical protein